MLGIWADENPEDNPGVSVRASFKGAAKSKSHGYTAPVNFVSGGVHQAGKKKDGDKKVEQKEKSSEDEDESQRSGLGAWKSKDADISATSR